MPASTLLLITIGILSVCAAFVHLIIRQHVHRQSSHRRSIASTPHDHLYADLLTPKRDRDLTSASV